MRKVFIIIIQIVVLIVFLRSDFATHFFGNAAIKIVDWYQYIVEVPQRRKIQSLRDKFFRNNMSLQPHQTDYVFSITETPESIEHFYRLYCESQDKNPYIFGKNLTKLCTHIQSSELLPKTNF